MGVERIITAEKVEPSFYRHAPWRIDIKHGPDTSMQDCAMYPGRPLEDPFIRMPLNEWCNKNLQQSWEFVSNYMLFENEEDALLFFMTYK